MATLFKKLFGKETTRGKRGTTSSSERRFYEPHSALGCLWRSIAFTLALFLIYIVVGWIISG